jgi:hypothetical protein
MYVVWFMCDSRGGWIRNECEWLSMNDESVIWMMIAEEEGDQR